MTKTRHRQNWFLPFITAALATTITAHAAESPSISVSGTEHKIRLEANNASLPDILAYLSSRFNVTFQSNAPLDREVSGRWEGTLRVVLDRLLHKHDYVARSTQGQLVVTIYRTDAGASNPTRPAPLAIGAARVSPPNVAPARSPAGIDNGYMK